MGMTLATKAALCVCPTLILGTAAVTMPKVRHAVHKATASRTAAVKSGHHQHHASQYAALSLPCPPAFAGLAPAIAGIGMPVVNRGGLARDFGLPSSAGIGGGYQGSGYARALFVGASSGSSGSAGAGGGSGSGSGSVDGTTGVVSGPASDPGAVPEPETWLMMVSGFAALGGALRWRRRGVASQSGPVPVGGSGPWRTRAGAAVAIAAPDSVGLAAVAGKSATLAKLALCVCPPALIAGTVATLPVARQAVHAATAPAQVATDPSLAFKPRPLAPCLPMVESAQSSGSGTHRILSVHKLDIAALSI